jgi:hypothetical protein
MATEQELLNRYSPFIRYDSLESYSADSVETMTDCWTPQNPHGNVLRAAGHELAAVRPPAGEAKLDLAFLRSGKYPNPTHAKVDKEDFLDVVGKEYVAEAHAMHLLPGMADQIYGHATTDSAGSLWLQYWFYAQHARGERCDWADVEKEDGAPIVYSARGSHASYFRRGNHPTEVPLVGWDYNDAGGPLVRPNLNVIEDHAPAWVAWPGRWGSTREQGEIFGKPIGADSPPGPSRHDVWNHPLQFHEAARQARDLSPEVGADLPLPPAPQVQAKRDGTQATVSFSFPVQDPPAPQLKAVLVSLDGEKDQHAPVTKLFEPIPADGAVAFPLELEDRAYTVRVSGVGEDSLTGPAGSTVLPA